VPGVPAEAGGALMAWSMRPTTRRSSKRDRWDIYDHDGRTLVAAYVDGEHARRILEAVNETAPVFAPAAQGEVDDLPF
jgi:hypothetical protein